jgi:hypothetical protein
MRGKLDISKDLNPKYFWDIYPGTLDVEGSKRLIIDRVFTMGTAKEIMLILYYYGEREVGKVLKKENYIDPKTLNFVSKLLNIPLKAFKCYSRQQLNQPPWNS